MQASLQMHGEVKDASETAAKQQPNSSQTATKQQPNLIFTCLSHLSPV
jgi:hypothetical protein